MADHKAQTEKRLLDLNSLMIRSSSPRRSDKPTFVYGGHLRGTLIPRRNVQQGPRPFPPQDARVNNRFLYELSSATTASLAAIRAASDR